MSTDTPADGVTPDPKDWTWVLTRPCTDCGFDPDVVGPDDIGPRVRAALEPWQEILRRPDVDARPEPGTWSPLEYGYHLRDVCRVFTGRLRSVVEEDDPVFADWDQDAAAVEARYGSADPGRVAAELTGAGTALARRFEELTAEQLARRGRRSDGAAFTAATLGQYLVHELVHHTWDVRARTSA